MAEQFFIKRGELINGPFTVEKLQALKKAKKLKVDDEISQSAEGPWDRIGDVYKNILNEDSVDEYEEPGDDQYDEEYAHEEAHDYEPTPPRLRTRTKSPKPGNTNTLAIISLVLGILSVTIGCCCWLHVPLGIAAAVTGFLGMQQCKQKNEGGYGMAMAGMILGLAALVLLTLMAIFGVMLSLADIQNQQF